MASKNKQEKKVYGVHACQAVFKTRPQDIIKVLLTKERAPQFSQLMQYLAKNKKGYNIESNEELESFAHSVHHEGICILTKVKKTPSVSDFLESSKKHKNLIFLALENIDNPHNLGAIIRSASHFGIHAIFYTSKSIKGTDGAVARVAQGGCEYVPTFHLNDWTELSTFCIENNILIYTTSDKAKESLIISSIKGKSLFVFGNENSGLSPYWKKIQSQYIKIDGTNLVESLNISVACAISMALYRQKFPLDHTLMEK